jgi:transcriptional regulator with XRE-family HTH domain
MKTIIVGAELAKARRKANLTQAEVADRMGTSQGAVSRIESGRVTPTLEIVDRYALAVGKPIRLVFGRRDSPISDDERRRRVERLLGPTPFNPWERDPTPAEERSLLADGLTRERFAR